MTWAQLFDFHLTEWACAHALGKRALARRHRCHLGRLIRERAAITVALVRRAHE